MPQSRAPEAARQPGVVRAGGEDNGGGVARSVHLSSAFCTGVEWPLVPPAHAGRSPRARTCARLGCMVTSSHHDVTQAGAESVPGPTPLFCRLPRPPQR